MDASRRTARLGFGEMRDATRVGSETCNAVGAESQTSPTRARQRRPPGARSSASSDESRSLPRRASGIFRGSECPGSNSSRRTIARPPPVEPRIPWVDRAGCWSLPVGGTLRPVRGATYSRLVRRLLLAESVGLNFDVETIRPGNTPAQLAYGFVSCGGLLLIDSAEPDGVPSLDKRTRKQVAKAVARSLDQQGPRQAAVFLAQAYAIDLYEFFRFRGDEANAEPHLGFQQLIQEHFPLSDEPLARLEATRAEYRTLEVHEVRDEVRIGVEIGTGYSRALIDPDFLDGRNPDDDEELVQIQRRYAGTFLRWHARLVAIEEAIGADFFAGVVDKLMFPGGPFGYDGLTFGQLEDVRWSSRGEMWQRPAKRAIGIALPEDDQLNVGPIDPVVARLRQDIVHWLETEDRGPLPEPTQHALAHFADEMASNEVDWGIATDALLMGYSLRVSEHELPKSEWI